MKIVLTLVVTAYLLITAIPIDTHLNKSYLRFTVLGVVFAAAVLELIYLRKQDRINKTRLYKEKMNFLILVLILFSLVYTAKYLFT
ncbi:MAG: hypothetical protein CFE23_09115 [Flavobacterium sp. BFFFF1]|nr:MAG: hypothetical protein CFE23_09115 [Flavobacterium sp. BFFFF1]